MKRYVPPTSMGRFGLANFAGALMISLFVCGITFASAGGTPGGGGSSASPINCSTGNCEDPATASIVTNFQINVLTASDQYWAGDFSSTTLDTATVVPSSLMESGVTQSCYGVINQTQSGLFIPYGTPQEFESFLNSSYINNTLASGGTRQLASAPIAQVVSCCTAGVCGIDNGGSFASTWTGDANLCTSGTASALTPVAAPAGWSWTCADLESGCSGTANCGATQSLNCSGGPSPAWDTNCSGTIPAGSYPSLASSGSVANTATGYSGTATFTCSNGVWNFSGGICSGAGPAACTGNEIAGLGLCTIPTAGVISSWAYTNLSTCVNMLAGADFYGIIHPGNVVAPPPSPGAADPSSVTDVQFFPPAGVTCSESEANNANTVLVSSSTGGRPDLVTDTVVPGTGDACQANPGSDSHMLTFANYQCTGTPSQTGVAISPSDPNWNVSNYHVYYQGWGCGTGGGCGGWSGDFHCPEVLSFPETVAASGSSSTPSSGSVSGCNAGTATGNPGDALCSGGTFTVPTQGTECDDTPFGTVCFPAFPACNTTDGGATVAIDPNAACESQANPLAFGTGTRCQSGNATGVCSADMKSAICTCSLPSACSAPPACNCPSGSIDVAGMGLGNQCEETIGIPVGSGNPNTDAQSVTPAGCTESYTPSCTMPPGPGGACPPGGEGIMVHVLCPYGVFTGACPVIPTINGSCGPANSGTYSSAAQATAAGLCTSGTPSAALSGSGPWSWTCVGSGGGASSGVCSAAVSAPSAACCPPGGSNLPSGCLYTQAVSIGESSSILAAIQGNNPSCSVTNGGCLSDGGVAMPCSGDGVPAMVIVEMLCPYGPGVPASCSE